MKKLLLAGVAVFGLTGPALAIDMTPEEMQNLYRGWQERVASEHFRLLGIEADRARAAGKARAGVTADMAARVKAETMRMMESAAEFAYTGCLARGVAGEKRCKQIFDVSVNALVDWFR